MTDTQKTTAAPVEAQKKPYQAPTLIEYGAVHQFTQGSGGMNGDGMAYMNRR